MLFIGLLIFLANSVFMTFTDSNEKVKSLFVIDLSKPFFHQVIVNFRDDLWYVLIYLSFCFIFRSVKNAWFTLGFSISLARLLYNSLILFRVIDYGAGYSDYLGVIIIVLFLIFEGAEWKFRLNIF